jgi:hypothetical protein
MLQILHCTFCTPLPKIAAKIARFFWMRPQGYFYFPCLEQERQEFGGVGRGVRINNRQAAGSLFSGVLHTAGMLESKVTVAAGPYRRPVELHTGLSFSWRFFFKFDLK